jgi:SAM-dependent methyltransferase
MMIDSRRSGGYWDSYYRQQGAPELPSQFALFVANEVVTGELPAPAAVLDIGCGNGRDTLFFARLGFQVGAIDQSQAAIGLCRERLERELGPAAEAARLEVGDAGSADLGLLAAQFEGPLLLYSRFFFHAIDADAELDVIAQAAAVLKRRGGALAVEYRSTEDASAAKVTSAHYRRFIDPDAFAARVTAAGLVVQWRAEGRGMAKYRADDAHVARLIAAP